MKPITILLAVVIAIAGCQKPKDPPTTPPAIERLRVKTIHVTGNNKASLKRYEYNSAGYLISYTSVDTSEKNLLIPNTTTTTLTMERDGDNKLTKEVVNVAQTGIYKGEYVYDFHNRVSRIEYTKNGTQDLAYIIYFTNKSDTVSGVGYQLPNFGKLIVYHDIEYDSLGKNTVVEILRRAEGVPPFKHYTNITYDSKRNPMKAIPGLHSYYYTTDVSPQVFSANNPTSYTYMSEPGQPAQQFTVDMEYNSLDYMTKAVVKGPGSSVTYTYTYEKY